MSEPPQDPDVSAAQLPIRQLLPVIYQDALQPGVRQLGQALESVVSLVPTLLLPLRYLSERMKLLMASHLDAYRQRLTLIKDEDIVPVAPELGVPVMESLLRTQDPQLAELYLSLLARAADRSTVNLAHPSFALVINNLCPDEALILGMLERNHLQGDSPDTGFPIVEIQRSNAEGYTRELGPLCSWNVDVELASNDDPSISAYIENLARLGLIEFGYERLLVPLTVYDRLSLRYKPFTDRGLRIHHGYGRITAYGELFIKACVPKHSQ